MDWNKDALTHSAKVGCHFLRGSVDWNKKLEHQRSFRVTSFAEVWIEICEHEWHVLSASVTSFAEVWIEIAPVKCNRSNRHCHFLRGSVDWNQDWLKKIDKSGSHFLRGSVDWNYCYEECFKRGSVTSFAEVWIEIRAYIPIGTCSLSLPSRKCGLKSIGTCSFTISSRSLPSRKCGLK